MFEDEGKAASVAEPQQQYFAASTSVWKPVQLRVLQRLEVEEKTTEPYAQVRVSHYFYIKRIVDCVLAAGLVILLSPVLVAVALRLWMKRGTTVFQRTPKMGRHCRTYTEYAFSTNRRLVRHLPILFNVAKGDLSFIGPRAACPGEMCEYCRHEARTLNCRNAIRPGLVCDWWIRRHASLDYVEEMALDIEYVEACSLRKDLGVVFRALPGLITLLIWGDDPPEYAPSIRILDVRIDNVSMQSAINRVMEMLDGSDGRHACFINPHYINEALRQPEYKEALEHANLVLADGFGTKLAGKILKRPIQQNLCGTDLFPRMCSRLSDSGKSIYLLGGYAGVAERAAEWITEHYPGVIIKGCGHGYFTPDEESGVVQKIATSGADLLIVAMGVPRQEVWIHRNLEVLNVKAAMGFGGLFDYFSGRIPRAPQWVREMGMEWVYRLIQEPRRMWRRYLVGNGIFLARVIRDRFRPRA